MTNLIPSNSNHLLFNIVQVHNMQITAQLVAQLSEHNMLTAILVTVTQAMLPITHCSQTLQMYI
jgi:hypothetical protein